MKNLILSLILLFSFVLAPPAFAIGTDKVVEEIEGKPGEVLTGSYRVFNTKDHKTHIDVDFKDWFVLPENKKEGIEASKWLKLEPMSFDLEPSESREVKYEVCVPEKAVGELVAMIYFAGPGAPGSNMNIRFGVSLYVAIAGTEKIAAEIGNFIMKKPIMPKNYKTPFNCAMVTIKNKGNVHIRPTIKVVVKDMKGNEVQKIGFKYGWPVYPGGEYTYQGDWYVEKIPQGIYQAEVKVSVDKIKDVLRKKIFFDVDKDGNIEIKKIGFGGAIQSRNKDMLRGRIKR